MEASSRQIAQRHETSRRLVLVPLITFRAMLPVSVAGLGVREGGAVYFFAKVGVDAATALSMSLAWFSSDYYSK